MHRYHNLTVLLAAPEDMLHVSAGWPSACYESVAKSGMIYRYAPAGRRPKGVRIAGFLARWGKRRERAYAEIARFLRVDPADIRDLVEAQIARAAERVVDLRRPGSRPMPRQSTREDARGR